MDKATILIVDDDLVVRRVLGDALGRAGYNIEIASSGAEALRRIAQPGIDLLLLDLQLGDIDGVAVMEEARRQWLNLPIIMLTAYGSLSSVIAAFHCSAADYLLKPISLDDLRKSVAAALKSYSNKSQQHEQLKDMYDKMQVLLLAEGLLGYTSTSASADSAVASVYESGPLRVDVRRHSVVMHGQPIDVTPIEFAILLELLSQPGVVISCSLLARATNTVASDEEEARQLIRPHIVRLRRKIELDPQQPCYLCSVRGMGYRWSGDMLKEVPIENVLADAFR